jgi:hypothetical protein
MVKSLAKRLLRWYDSAGTTMRTGFIRSITNTGGTLTINIAGDAFSVGDRDLYISLPSLAVQNYQIFIPGELLADSEDVGMEIIFPFKSHLIAIDSVLKTVATGGSESLKYNVYANGTALFSTDRQHTTNADLLNQIPTTRTINAGDRITLRITESTGTTTKSQGLSVIYYYFDFNAMEVTA